MSYVKVFEHDSAELRQAAIERLRNHFPPGALVNVVLRHVSDSGMTRSIQVLATTSELGPYDVRRSVIVDVTSDVARVLDRRIDRTPYRAGVEVRGTGMDVGVALVRELSSALYTIDDVPNHPGRLPGSRVDQMLTSKPL